MTTNSDTSIVYDSNTGYLHNTGDLLTGKLDYTVDTNTNSLTITPVFSGPIENKGGVSYWDYGAFPVAYKPRHDTLTDLLATRNIRLI